VSWHLDAMPAEGKRKEEQLIISLDDNTLAISQRVAALRIQGNHRKPSQETLAEETPIAFVYYGIAHAVGKEG